MKQDEARPGGGTPPARLPAVLRQGSARLPLTVRTPRYLPQWPVVVRPAPDSPETDSGWRLPGALRAFAYVLVPLAAVVMLTGLFAYVKLLHSPIPLAFLTSAIEQGLSAEMGGRPVHIGGAELALAPKGGLEFRLHNLRLLGAGGAPIANVPLAAAEISLRAMWSLRLAPARVELIEPRISITAAPGGRISLGFSGEPSRAQGGGPSRGEERARGTPDSPTVSPSFPPRETASVNIPDIRARDLLPLLAGKLREGANAAPYLREIGVRQAIVSLTAVADSGASSHTTWYVPRAGLAVTRPGGETAIAGTLAVDSPRGPWDVSFSVNRAASGGGLVLKASFQDVVPSVLAGAAPGLKTLAALDAPVSGTAAVNLSASGELHGADMSLSVAGGDLLLPSIAADDAMRFQFSSARFSASYNGQERQVTLHPSTLVWGESRITIAGKITEERAAATPSWRFEIASTEGRLAAEEFTRASLPIDSCSVKGEILPAQAAVRVETFALKAGGGGVTASGEASLTQDSGGARFEGRTSAMPLATAKMLWPRLAAPGARLWVNQHAAGGSVSAGRFRILSGSYREDKSAERGAGFHADFTLGTRGTTVIPLDGMPPLDIPEAQIRLSEVQATIEAPGAAFVLDSGEHVPLQEGRVVLDYAEGRQAAGAATFKISGPLAPVLRLLGHQPFALSARGLPLAGIDGTLESELKAVFSLDREKPSGSPAHLEGTAQVTDGRARELIGPYDVQGASVTFGFSEHAVNATGQMLLNGVLARLDWQYIFGAPAGKQPPLRIGMSLDNADRAQLGLDVNHFLQGEIPLEITAARDAENTPVVRLRADLTNAELLLEGLAWRKPPGRPAFLDCGIVANPSGRTTELRDIQLMGDGIAIAGHAILDSSNRLREFQFPQFSLDVITQLDVRGVLRRDNVLDLKVRGTALDGRNIFRTLFSVGSLAQRNLEPMKPRAGVDMDIAINTVLGFFEVGLHSLKMKAVKRGDRLVAVNGQGTLDGGAPFTVTMRNGKGEQRELLAQSPDAGQAFKFTGFYPGLQGGQLRLETVLDRQGAAEKTGTLWVDNFRILGDPVATELFTTAEEMASSSRGGGAKARPQREVFVFDRMRLAFSVGHGQFVLDDARLTGPLFGVHIRGKVDYGVQRVALEGTYIPLQWLNNAFRDIPLIGPIASGPRGEGMFGVKFTLEGAMTKPQVMVNPLSLATPGIFREIFQTHPRPRISPRKDPKPAAPRALVEPAGRPPPGAGKAGSNRGQETPPSKNKKAQRPP